MKALKIILIIILIIAILIGGILCYYKYFAFVPDKDGMENTNITENINLNE